MIGPLLDWTGAEHWNAGRRVACRLCGTPALLRDAARRPCHKRCAEEALAAAGWRPPPPAVLEPAPDEEGDPAALFGPADVRRFVR